MPEFLRATDGVVAAVLLPLVAGGLLVRHRGIPSTLFDGYPGATVAGILLHASMCTVLFVRGLSRAPSRSAASGVRQADEALLRPRLRSAMPAGHIQRDDAGEFFVAPPEAATTLRLRSDPTRGVVQVVQTSRSIRTRGRAMAWSVHRTVSRPALAFLQPIGG